MWSVVKDYRKQDQSNSVTAEMKAWDSKPLQQQLGVMVAPLPSIDVNVNNNNNKSLHVLNTETQWQVHSI